MLQAAQHAARRSPCRRQKETSLLTASTADSQRSSGERLGVRASPRGGPCPAPARPRVPRRGGRAPMTAAAVSLAIPSRGRAWYASGRTRCCVLRRGPTLGGPPGSKQKAVRRGDGSETVGERPMVDARCSLPRWRDNCRRVRLRNQAAAGEAAAPLPSRPNPPVGLDAIACRSCG